MKKSRSKTVKNQKEKKVDNGLSAMIMGNMLNPYGTGTQLNQTDTVFENLRFYLISNMRQALSESYVELGLLQAVVNIPVDDAFRGGIEISSSQLSPEELLELQNKYESEGVAEDHAWAHKWARLFGGGAILVMTGQDHSTPLKLDQNALKGAEFRSVDMWELFNNKSMTETEMLQVKDDPNWCFDYYGLRVHKSRVFQIKGSRPPSFVRPRLRGWGFSVAEHLVQSLNQFLKTRNLVFEVLDEFKLDIYKLKGFNSLMMSADAMTKATSRVQFANQLKNYLNALVIDADDDHISKQLSFTGISEIQKELRIQIASDLRMPMTKLFGMSASGFNSGEDDIEVYNSMVESDVRVKAKVPIIQTLKIMCARDFGIVPDDLQITFKPLRILSSVDEENVKNHRLDRLLKVYEKGILSNKQFKAAINKADLLPIKLESEEPDVQENKEIDQENKDSLSEGDSGDLPPKV